MPLAGSDRDEQAKTKEQVNWNDDVPKMLGLQEPHKTLSNERLESTGYGHPKRRPEGVEAEADRDRDERETAPRNGAVQNLREQKKESLVRLRNKSLANCLSHGALTYAKHFLDEFDDFEDEKIETAALKQYFYAGAPAHFQEAQPAASAAADEQTESRYRLKPPLQRLANR
jgi:hypothetical protein